MKKTKIIEEVENEGFLALIDKPVQVWCMNYIYSGVLTGVNEHDILLTDAKVVYETGELSARAWKDAQTCPKPLYIRTSAIESYSEVDHG